jgi:hypothetical protein
MWGLVSYRIQVYVQDLQWGFPIMEIIHDTDAQPQREQL